jgi:hypothetical protein
MDEVTLKITHVELELIDALVVAAVERLDERIDYLRRKALQQGDWNLDENEDIHRLMRLRYTAIGRRLELLRDPVPA